MGATYYRASIETDGRVLVSAEERHAANPESFEIPSKASREALLPGVSAKLLFDIETRVLSVMEGGAAAVDDWYQQQALAQREREQAEREAWQAQQEQTKREWDDWWKQREQAQREAEQAERDRQFWQAQRDTHQYIWDLIERNRQWQEEMANKVYDDHPWARAGWTAGAEWKDGGWVLPESSSSESAASAPRAAVVPRPPAPPIWLQSQGNSPQRLARLNPFAFRLMVLQHQARVRQQMMQSRGEMPHRTASTLPQEIRNPFVGAAPEIQGRQEIDPRIIQNPFVSSAK